MDVSYGITPLPISMIVVRSHYPDRASALGFKDTATPRFGHSDVVFYLFIETRVLL